MMEEPRLRDREGNRLRTVAVKRLRLVRGGGEVLERIPWYRGRDGEWYVEWELINTYAKEKPWVDCSGG